MLPILRTLRNSYVDIDSIYSGEMILFSDNELTESLRSWCITCIHENFGPSFEIEKQLELAKDDFIFKATQTKKQFTNSETTKSLLENIIVNRYHRYSEHEIFYDVPRVRIIPPSIFLNSGISYNYKPHRDTWYGGNQRQINHWISVENVSSHSTFFIAPSYFDEPVNNSSKYFDLDKWDQVYRPLASKNTEKEERPHPVPESEIPNQARISIALEKGHEICFSGHHLHGSLPNITDKVRISIDFRIEVATNSYNPPPNIDDESSGNYLKYMIKHPAFGT